MSRRDSLLCLFSDFGGKPLNENEDEEYDQRRKKRCNLFD